MSIFVKAKSEEHGELTFAIQQYGVGLYVCIYKAGRMLEQFGSDETEAQFIKRLKKCKGLTIMKGNEDESINCKTKTIDQSVV